MAERRMMSKKIIHSDAFLDMPATSQNLYFHLLLEADDEGFVNSPKRIQRTVGASDGDAQMLLAKKFIFSFESGVVVIKHWRIHNYIQNDRFKATTYVDERNRLSIDKNDGYKLDTNCTPSIGKESIVEVSLGEESVDAELDEPFSFSLSKDTHFDNLSKEYRNRLKIEIEALGMGLPYETFVEALQTKSSYKYKNFLLVYKNWAKKDNSNRPTKYDGMVATGQISKEVAKTMTVLDDMKW